MTPQHGKEQKRLRAYAGGIATAGQAETASVLRPGLRSPISVTALSSIERQHEMSSCTQARISVRTQPNEKSRPQAVVGADLGEVRAAADDAHDAVGGHCDLPAQRKLLEALAAARQRR